MEATHLRILQLGQHTLAVQSFNEHATNTPLVFIHGITSSVNFWGREQTPLVAGQRWYSLSLPGHYPSTFPQNFDKAQLTPDLIADLTEEALQQLVGDQPIILAGHSTGGFTTVAVSAKYPARVKAAICISGFAHGYWTGALRLLQQQARLGAAGQLIFKLNMRTLTSTFRVYKASLRAYAADRKALYSYPNLDAVVREQYADATHLDLDAMLAYFNRMPDIDITDWLPRIQAPLLVIAGSADMIVPPEQARIIAAAAPNSTLHMIEGAGHLPMTERKDEYHQTITDWLSRYL